MQNADRRRAKRRHNAAGLDAGGILANHDARSDGRRVGRVERTSRRIVANQRALLKIGRAVPSPPAVGVKMRKRYAVDKLEKGIWRPVSQTDLTLRKAEKLIGKIVENGGHARLMSWTQARGYQEVYNISMPCAISVA